MRNRKNILNIVVAIIIILLACTPVLSLTPIPVHPVSLRGAGASFPQPLYYRWSREFNKKYPNLQINYEGIGSGAGIKEFTEERVDFGASDYAMTDEQIALVKRGVITLPLTADAVVIVYNLPGVRNLKLPRLVYIDMFLGKIKYWDDPAIVKANPSVSFPKLPVTVVYHSGGTYTTQTFTTHLSAISQEWKNKVGSGRNVKWPVGIGIKGTGLGPADIISRTPGSIGYLNYAYGIDSYHNLKMATLENKAGQFVEPIMNSFTQTLNSVKLPDNLRVFITDPNGANSYPIVAYTWLLVYKKYDDPDKAATLKHFLNWSLTEGQKIASTFRCVPLPFQVINQIREKVNLIH